MAITKATTLANFASGITGIGSVGIGTTDPRLDLEINGDVRLSDNSPRLFLYDSNATGASSATGGFEVFDKDGNKNVFVGAFAPNADNLIFGVTGSEKLRIDSSGNIGIGTDDASWGVSTGLIVGDGASAEGITLFSNSTNVGDLAFADATSGTARYSGLIRYDHSDDSLALRTNSSERLRIKSDGKVGISQTDPNATLHLGGNAAAHGDLTNPAFQIGGTGTYRFGIYTGNEDAVIANENGDNGIKIRVKTWGTAAQFTNSAWSKDSVNYPGIILGSDSEHVVGYGNSIATSGDVGDNTFIRGRNIELYTYDRIFFRTGSGGSDWMRFYSGTYNASMNLTNDGYLLIGYSSSNGSYKLQVNSQIYATSSTIATSDQRYKENIQSLDGCYDIVKQLNPVSFTWKNDANVYHPTEVESYENEILDDDGNKTGTFETVTSPKLLREGHNFPTGTQVGFLAQEVQSALSGKSWVDSIIKSNSRPQYDDDGNKLSEDESFYGIAEGNMISVLTSALKESIAKIEELQIKVTSLESHVGIAST